MQKSLLSIEATKQRLSMIIQDKFPNYKGHQTKKKKKTSHFKSKLNFAPLTLMAKQAMLYKIQRSPTQIRRPTTASSVKNSKGRSIQFASKKRLKSILSQRQQELQHITLKIQQNQKGPKCKFDLKKISPNHSKVVQKSDSRFRNFLNFIVTSCTAYGILADYSLTLPPPIKIKYFIGIGNNSNLVKSIMARRFWLQQTLEIEEANFIWTQIKIRQLFDKQESQSFQLKPIKSKIVHKIFTNHQLQSFQQSNTKFKTATLTQQDLLKLIRQRRSPLRVHNHLPMNNLISNKKSLFQTLRKFSSVSGCDLFQMIPLTFHICSQADNSFSQFIYSYRKYELLVKQDQVQFKNIWIVKPGEITNRGQGIFLIEDIYQLQRIMNQSHPHLGGVPRTFIVQKYIQKPFLYNRRKFDLRQFVLVTCLGGVYRCYWYSEGYVRTSSYIYSIEYLQDEYIHLTNDAIQAQCNDYGTYQSGNKLTYSQIQRYIQSNTDWKVSFQRDIIPQMKQIVRRVMSASVQSLDPLRRSNFQLFGLDFILDQNLKPWLLQINSNPCLEADNKVLALIIPLLLEQTFRLSLDLIYPPDRTCPPEKRHLISDNPMFKLRYQLLWHEDCQQSMVPSQQKEYMQQGEQEQYHQQGVELVIIE